MCTVQDLEHSDFEEKPSFTLVLIRLILEMRRTHIVLPGLPSKRHSILKDLTEPRSPFFSKRPLGNSLFSVNLGFLHWLTCMPWLILTRTRPCELQISRKSSCTLVMACLLIRNWPSFTSYLPLLFNSAPGLPLTVSSSEQYTKSVHSSLMTAEFCSSSKSICSSNRTVKEHDAVDESACSLSSSSRETNRRPTP